MCMHTEEEKQFAGRVPENFRGKVENFVVMREAGEARA